MSLYLQMMLCAGLFIGIVLVVQALFSLTKQTGGAGDPQVKRRLEALRRVSISGGADGVSVRQDKGEQADWLRYVPFSKHFSKVIVQSGTDVTEARAIFLMLALALVTFVALNAFLPILPLPLSLVLAPVMGIAPVYFFLKSAGETRRRKFEALLPEALDLMVRSLKVGHPLSSAMSVVAREIPAPLGPEFQIAFDQVTFGDEVPSAFIKMTERVHAPDLAYLTTAIQIQYESGGNLAEVLSKLSEVIRDRFRMFRKVKAITAEGRFSAWFLSLFPVAMIFTIQLVKPDYYSQVYDFPYFPHLAGVTFVLLAVNIVAMKVITSIRV